MDFSKLKAINDKKAQEAKEAQNKTEAKLANLDLQETFVKSISTLVDFLDGNVTKSYVVNQLKTISTPDVEKVVKAVESLHETQKTHKNTDLSEITKVLSSILDEAKKLPKELPESPEQKFVDYSEQLADIQRIVENVVEAIKKQKTAVEAPIVNIPETVVNVPAQDLKPLEKGLKDVKSEISKIEIPKTNLAGVETRLDKSNKLLKEIVEKPVGGGGGGGSSWTAVNENGIPIPLQVIDGALKTTSVVSDFQFNDSDATTTVGAEYFGYTKPDGTWLVKKLTDTTLRYATVTNNGAVLTYGDAWADVATLTYGRFDQAF
jgi:hypothetical protein